VLRDVDRVLVTAAAESSVRDRPGQVRLAAVRVTQRAITIVTVPE